MIRIALYQPDIAQNTGTVLRLCACLGIEAHIIEPAGFPVTDRHFRRAGMDYLDRVAIVRHTGWAAFEAWRAEAKARLLLFTTAGAAVWNALLIEGGRRLAPYLARYEHVASWVIGGLLGLIVLVYLYRVATWKPHGDA